MEFKHISVMLNEVLENLDIKPDGIYLDGTLGGAGHSSEIVSRLDKGHLYGTDQDADAIRAASERLKPFEEKVTIIRTNFENAVNELKLLGVDGLDGILLDLGVSSYQLDEADRGFSYRYDAPLDMRMDDRAVLSASDIVNGYSGQELTRILRVYGEEPFAANIAKHIVARRAEHKIETTGELNEIVHAAIPAKMRTKGGNPSKRTFQAIRIECNRELEVLENSLDDMITFLKPGGRFCVITFHSLEDRIVKECFKRNENPCTCPPQFPVCVCGKTPQGKVITRKPITATKEELEYNTRSASAKLRVFEKR